MTTSITGAAVSAFAQLVVLGIIPLLFYSSYHKWRNKLGWREIAKRTGLQNCSYRYLLVSAFFALASVAAVLVWLPPSDVLAREGTALYDFVGLELGVHAITLVLLHTVIKTGLTEEILFRGLIAGSISRRLPVFWANTTQALIFLLPHLLIIYIMPEMWALLPIIFVMGLVVGWIRIKSGSIIGPWLIHGSTNLAAALSIVTRTSA